MPPSAITGLIIGTSVAIAATIAVLESPQVRELIRKGRRKLAEWLHALGDGVSPEEKRRILELHDISMTEEKGEEAERRRQRAREEIIQRATVLERRRNRFVGPTTSSSSSSSVSCLRPATSFDGLVDKDGKLISRDDYKGDNDATRAIEVSSTAQSTGVDVSGAVQQVQRQEAVERHSATTAAAAAAAAGAAAAAAAATVAAPGIDHIITDPFSDLAMVDESHPAIEPISKPDPAAEPAKEQEKEQVNHEHEHDYEDEHETTGFMTPRSATATATPTGSAPATPRNREQHIPIPENLQIPTGSSAHWSETYADADDNGDDDDDDQPANNLSIDALREHERGDVVAQYPYPSHHDEEDARHSNAASTLPEMSRSPSVHSRAEMDVLSMTDTSTDMLSDLESMRGGQLTPEWSEVGSVVSDDEHHAEDHARH